MSQIKLYYNISKGLDQQMHIHNYIYLCTLHMHINYHDLINCILLSITPWNHIRATHAYIHVRIPTHTHTHTHTYISDTHIQRANHYSTILRLHPEEHAGHAYIHIQYLSSHTDIQMLMYIIHSKWRIIIYLYVSITYACICNMQKQH